jgi:hypothetical protein
MLAGSRLENSYNGFPPQPQDAGNSAAAFRFLMLFVENGFHLRSEIAAKIEGEHPQQCPIKAQCP